MNSECEKNLAALMAIRLDRLERHGELIDSTDRYSPVGAHGAAGDVGGLIGGVTWRVRRRPPTRSVGSQPLDPYLCQHRQPAGRGLAVKRRGTRPG
jgi:hypothetical protein